MMPSLSADLGPWTQHVLIFLELLLIEQQLIMLANSVVVATNWRYRPMCDYNAEKTTSLVWLHAKSSVVFKPTREATLNCRVYWFFQSSVRARTSGHARTFSESYQSPNLNGSFRLDVLWNSPGRAH